jgi:ribonuclease HI
VTNGRSVVIHADESCLGNGQERATPGGAASLIERVATGGGVSRHDCFISAPDTTNNRMALSGAIATLALVSQLERRSSVVFVSDSEYLVKGMREWVPGWVARGWKRKGGAVENLELWQALVKVAAGHDVAWRWVRGHAGDPKNEYVNDLAMAAATKQLMSRGAEPSGFAEWMARSVAKGRYAGYDADAAFTALAAGTDNTETA